MRLSSRQQSSVKPANTFYYSYKMTRRQTIGSLAASALLLAIPVSAAAPDPAPASPSAEAAQTLRRLLRQYRKAQQFKEQDYAEGHLTGYYEYRSIEKEIQAEIAELLLAQPELLATAIVT